MLIYWSVAAQMGVCSYALQEYPRFHLLNAYVPNSGEGLKNLDSRLGKWDGRMAGYARALKEATGKPVIITGKGDCRAITYMNDRLTKQVTER